MTTIGSLEGDSNSDNNNGNNNNKNDDDDHDDKKEYAFQIESDGGHLQILSQLMEQSLLVRKILKETMVKTLT